MNINEEVILVDENDIQTGTMEKIEAHKKALLHRAFSIFIFNSKGELLLQKRAVEKYHSPGLWTNACCSHPRPGETLHDAAQRRLYEEMGFTTSMEKIFSFTYKADFHNGLTEYEFDHVFYGTYDDKIVPNILEVCDFKYISMTEVLSSIELHPEQYTAWFKIALPKIKEYLDSSSIS